MKFEKMVADVLHIFFKSNSGMYLEQAEVGIGSPLNFEIIFVMENIVIMVVMLRQRLEMYFISFFNGKTWQIVVGSESGPVGQEPLLIRANYMARDLPVRQTGLCALSTHG